MLLHFTSTYPSLVRQTTIGKNDGNNQIELADEDQYGLHYIQGKTSRRTLLNRIFQSTLILPLLSTTSVYGVDADRELRVIVTQSGLKYIDLVPGTGISPQYGNLCSVQYTSYLLLAKTVENPNPVPQQFDKSSGYLIKHGNGKMIPGLDEGIHTMKTGGIRRILIPPKLGYIDSGLGPIPEYPWQRNKLNSLLDKMVAIGSGTLIFEVKLLSVIEDEADQGYYSDDSLSPEDFATLQNNLRIQGLQQRATATERQSPSTSTSSSD